MRSPSCQVVLVATETPDVVDLGDVIGFLQAQYQSTQKRGTLTAGAPLAPLSPPAAAAGKAAKKDSVIAGSTLSPLASGPPPTLVFEKVGLGGDPLSPIPLEGAELTAAVLQTLHRLAEKRSAADCATSADGSADPLVVVVGCPSMDLVHALMQTAQPVQHEIRMLLTVTSMEPFPAAPSVTAIKGAKKPDPKKAGGKGGKGVGDKTGSPSSTVRIESGMRRLEQCKHSVKFLRVHFPTAAATEGIVVQSILPELSALEASLGEFSRWFAEKDLVSVPYTTGSELQLSAHTRLLADVAHTTHARAIGDIRPVNHEDTSTNVWRLEAAVSGILSQMVINTEAHSNPLRNVQLIDTAALERLKVAEAATASAAAEALAEQSGDDTPPGLEEEKAHAELPRKGPPMFVQSRPDIKPSSPDQVQWMVRQFVKQSIGKLRPDSEPARELAMLLRGAAKAPGFDEPDKVSPADTWTAEAVRRRTDIVNAAMADSPKVPSTRPIPVGVQLLRRATAAAGGAPLTSELPASIDRDLVAAMERSHTQREIQRGLAMTMLEQVAREEFPNLVKARFQLQPYVYSEAMHTPAMTNRLSQYMQRYGSNVVKVVRVQVDDPDNLNALASAVSIAAQLSKVPTPHEVIVAGVQIPASSDAKRSLVTTSLAAVSGAPSFAQFVDWSKTVASAGDGSAPKQHAPRDVLTSSMVKATTVNDLMQQCSFFQPTGTAGVPESILAHEGRWTIFPYDSSVVDVIRDAVGNKACHTVRLAKDDVVCTLKAQATLDSLQFCATFDDGTIMTIAPRTVPQHEPRVPSPALVGTPDSNANSRAASSHRASRLNTAQSVGQGTILSRTSSANAAPVLDAIVVDDGFDALGNVVMTPTGAMPAQPSNPIQVIPTFDVTVAYGDMTLAADEQDSNLMFRFTNQCIAAAVVEGTIDGETVQSFSEFEVARQVLHSTGCTVRYFASGSVQSLQADGSLATLVRRSDTHPQPFWLITSASGEQFVKGAFPGAPPTRKLDTFFCDVRQSVDRENDCDVFSRADGVVMAFYRAPGHAAASTGMRLHGGDRTYHTRVVVHADGTYVVSRLDGTNPLDNDKVVAPALVGLFKQFDALASIGAVSFVVETPNCPRVFLFGLKGSGTDTTNESAVLPLLQREFLVQFGDGSVMKRQSVPRYQGAGDMDIRPAGAPASSRFLETTLCKAGETTLRFHHDTALAFVEPHSIHLSPLTATSIALCEGVGVFDLALGGFRLVDFRAHVTTVSDLLDMDKFPTVHAVRPSNETQLLLSMAPVGYAPHCLPKRNRDELQKTKEAAQREQFERSQNGQTIPSLTDRLRELTAQYIVEHRLISKGARRKHPGELGITAAGAASHSTSKPVADSMLGGTQGSKDLMASTLALMHTAEFDTAPPTPANVSPTQFAPFLTEVRPLLFVRYADGTVAELLCVQDVAQFVHSTQTAPRTVTVSRTYCSGEPGVEQLTFVGSEVAAFGTKAMRVSVDASPLQGSGASWLPRTMLPPRRMVTHSAKAVAEASARQQVRTLLKFQPLSMSARLVSARQEVRRQDQLLAMHNYNASIQNSICVVASAELDAQAALRSKYLTQRGTPPTAGSTTATPPPPPPGPACFVEPAAAPSTFDMPYAEEEMDATAEPLPTAGDVSPSAPHRASLHRLNVVSFAPKAADFGPLIAGLRYAYPVVLRSHTTDTLLFEVYRPKRTINGIQMVSVQTSSFMVSPLGESTIYVMLNLPDEAMDILAMDPADPSGVQRLVSESIRMECAQLKTKFEVAVTAAVRPSLAVAKLALDATSGTTATPVNVPRKPRVDTRQPPPSAQMLHDAGYFGDLVIDTSVRVVGQAV